MSVQKLPSGRWRAQVHDPACGKNISVGKVLGGASTFKTKTDAKQARAKARDRLQQTSGRDALTVADWRERWTTDPLFQRPKESTNVHNAERTAAFAERFGSVSVAAMGTDRGDAITAEWLAGGRRNGSVSALRAMFNDAMSAKGGRLLDRNPFAGLGIAKGKGNAEKQPPSEADLELMLGHARELTPPSFAAYLEFGGLSAARPSELDALRWEWVRWDDGEVDLREQWSAKVRKFTEPKYGPYTIALTARARQVLLTMKRDSADSPFVFNTLRGTHYTPSSRNHHWNRVRAAAGFGNAYTLYLATRHYFGWYATNVLELPPDVVARQLGHKDGGRLVAQLYGHLDGKLARRRIRTAFDSAGTVTPLRVVGEGTA
jgi:integrase